MAAAGPPSPRLLSMPRPADVCAPNLPLLRCCLRLHDGKNCGVIVYYRGRGRLERCELWGNANGGVWVLGGGDPSLHACTFRDHTGGRAAGVYVGSGSNATVGADCVFARNAKGGVVRE